MQKSTNNYTSNQTDYLIIEYDPEKFFTWPYFPIVMPLDKDGNGPTTDEECYKITWEIWDKELNTISSHNMLSDCIIECLRLNKEFVGD